MSLTRTSYVQGTEKGGSDFLRSVTGSVEPGKLADLVVLGADLARVPVTEIRQVPVAMTVIGGEIVFEA